MYMRSLRSIMKFTIMLHTQLVINTRRP